MLSKIFQKLPFRKHPAVRLFGILFIAWIMLNLLAGWVDNLVYSPGYLTFSDNISFAALEAESTIKSFFEQPSRDTTIVRQKGGITGTPTPTPEVVTYTAPTLGIQVTYNKYWEFAADPAVKDNVLYFSKEDSEKGGGQRIEVIDKDPHVDITQGVVQAIGKKYDLIACPVEVVMDDLSKPTFSDGFNFPKSYRVGQLVPAHSDWGIGGSYNNDKCPWDYIPNDRLNFFFFDTDHPNKLFFHEAEQGWDPWTGKLRFL